MKSFVTPALMAVTLVFSTVTMAQMDHSMHGSAAAKPSTFKAAEAAMGEGVVKKVDKVKASVTLAHGAMNGMPAMTMVYKVKDVVALEKLQIGQKVRFATDPADGGMTLTQFELVK
jgi:Cu/Ag efflux protein CusF